MLPLLWLAVSGCTDLDDPAGPGDDPIDGNTVVELALSDFPAIAQSEAHFELWISFASPGARAGTSGAAPATVPVSAGKFKVNDAAQVVGLDYQPATFAIDATDPRADADGDGLIDWDSATSAFISLEPPGDSDEAPSSSTLIAGGFAGDAAALGPTDPAALGVGFSGIDGSFVLETPTTTAATDSANSPQSPGWDLAGGVWFTNSGGGSPTLTLPILPSDGGWIYEGWISLGFAETFSLGSFRDPGGPDSDRAGPLPPADAPGYAYPGSDFPAFQHATDLSSGNVFVTVEPIGNQDGPGPFTFLTMLVSSPIPNDPSPGLSLPLGETSRPLPTAIVRIPTASAVTP